VNPNRARRSCTGTLSTSKRCAKGRRRADWSIHWSAAKAGARRTVGAHQDHCSRDCAGTASADGAVSVEPLNRVSGSCVRLRENRAELMKDRSWPEAPRNDRYWVTVADIQRTDHTSRFNMLPVMRPGRGADRRLIASREIHAAVCVDVSPRRSFQLARFLRALLQDPCRARSPSSRRYT
jgi:hypothetical protein